MISKFVRIVCLSLCLALLPSALLQAAPLELKFGVATGEGHHYYLGMKAVKEAVEKATGGEVIVHIYSGGQLSGNERELIEGLQLGTVDITLVATGPLASYDPNFNFFSLPYLYEDEAALYADLDGDLGAKFVPTLEKSGIKLMGWTLGGTMIVTNSRSPINTATDAKGLKIRCQENNILMATWKSLGAVPTPMSLAECFTALQQGTVDGQENATAGSYFNKYYEVQKYMSLTNHWICPGPFLMSEAKFKAMSPELQKKFLAGFKEGIAAARKFYAEQTQDATMNMEKMGVVVNTPSDPASFKKAVQPVYDEFLSVLTPEFQKLAKERRAANM